jgi:hypothetical protein
MKNLESQIVEWMGGKEKYERKHFSTHLDHIYELIVEGEQNYKIFFGVDKK